MATEKYNASISYISDIAFQSDDVVWMDFYISPETQNIIAQKANDAFESAFTDSLIAAGIEYEWYGNYSDACSTANSYTIHPARRQPFGRSVTLERKKLYVILGEPCAEFLHALEVAVANGWDAGHTTLDSETAKEVAWLVSVRVDDVTERGGLLVSFSGEAIAVETPTYCHIYDDETRAAEDVAAILSGESTDGWDGNMREVFAGWYPAEEHDTDDIKELLAKPLDRDNRSGEFESDFYKALHEVKS